MQFVKEWEKQVTHDGEVILRPILEAAILRKDGELCLCRFIVDSGADLSLAPRRLARELGIDWREGRPIDLVGISKRKVCKVEGRVHTVELFVPELSVAFEIPVCFAKSNAPLLLGREGFFDAIAVEFDKPSDRLAFRLVPD